MKQSLLKIINPLLFLSMLFQFASGIGMAQLHLGWMREVHEINGMAGLALIAVHVSLNFKWFVSLWQRKR
ncbi:DUF4405 domain-containing protein [candidate division FCPU426 bacterium]|nr:DUF4405 domain-containing protein [candidate division FCPU426 bacterium]